MDMDVKDKQISIVRACADDAFELLEFLKIVGGETDNLSFGAEGIPLGVEDEKSYLNGQVRSADNVQYLAKHNGEIVGTASLNRKPRRMSHRGEVGISLKKAYWGLGIASSLMKRILEFAQANGFEQLDLEVRSDNARAIRLYEKFGFQKLCTFPAFFKIDGRYVDFDLMSLRFFECPIQEEKGMKGRREDETANVIYEHKPEMTLIGFSTTIPSNEGYIRCPQFWDEEYSRKYSRLWQTMNAKTPIEKSILENGIGGFAICEEKEGFFEYWIAGLYKGGEVPEGLALYTFPESDWAMFSSKGPLPDSLQKLNTYVWQKWYPNEGGRHLRNGNAMLEVYMPGDMQSPDYECGIWVPVKRK